LQLDSCFVCKKAICAERFIEFSLWCPVVLLKRFE
jgi:hypothetical protein